jgi:hypothetical protein
MILKDVVEAVEKSDVARINALRGAIDTYGDPWKIHLSLFPAVERVLNPPFINPHLPKMYNICRDLASHLSKEGKRSLLYLELVEYARRPKLEPAPRKAVPRSTVSFADIEKSIAEKDRDTVALLLDAFIEQQGLPKLIRRLLLLGSGYLSQSLGHSVSCTAFILLELLRRRGVNRWPALILLADYFCKGGFCVTPPVMEDIPELSLDECLSRSVTGTGFVDLHHTITLFAIERTRSFLTHAEHRHMMHAWARFMGEKPAEPRSFTPHGKIGDYARFRESFSQLDANLMLDLTGGMIGSATDRSRLCAFLVTGVCDLYQGNYDPHYLTGLGSLLWLTNTYHHNAGLVQDALYQYLSFYFKNVRSEDRR